MIITTPYNNAIQTDTNASALIAEMKMINHFIHHACTPPTPGLVSVGMMILLLIAIVVTH